MNEFVTEHQAGAEEWTAEHVLLRVEQGFGEKTTLASNFGRRM